MICIPVIAETQEEALRDIEEASKLGDVVELRMDYIKNPDLGLLLQRRNKPVIVTNRPVREGGKFTGSEEDRVATLQQAVQMQADYVDIEHDSVDKVRCSGGTKLIVSYHNFKETPGNLSEIYGRLCQSNADIVKLVTYANEITDNASIYRLLRQPCKPTISFCMGEHGIMSRILYKKFGSYLTYSYLSSGKESAPGQVNIHELLMTYRARLQDKDTGIYGLIGNPVSHSIGTFIHNALFAESALNSVYVPFLVNRIDDFMREFRGLDIKGCSVTIPHKESIIKFLDALDPLSEKIGAVNTVVNKDGRLVGFNTDCMAAIKSLEEEGAKERNGAFQRSTYLKGKRVTIIGAGGAARAIAYGLKERGAQITIINRNYSRAESLARDVGCLWMKFDEFQPSDTNILINATPVGMFPKVDEIPISVDKLKPGTVVFDTIYNPIETRLLREAGLRGCRIVNGLSMFIYQAAAQFELWTGLTPPLELIEKVALNSLTRRGRGFTSKEN